MRIFLKQIPPQGRSFEFRLPGSNLREWLADRPEIRWVSDAMVTVEATRIDQLVTLRGRAEFAVKFDCARCAESFDADLQVPIEMVLAPARVGEEALEDVGTGFHNGNDFAADRIVLEQIALALPPQLICGEDCQGVAELAD